MAAYPVFVYVVSRAGRQVHLVQVIKSRWHSKPMKHARESIILGKEFFVECILTRIVVSEMDSIVRRLVNVLLSRYS